MLECPKGCCQIAMPQDVYCGICGTKLEEIRKCPTCEYTLFLSDRFCRKCGKPVSTESLQAEIERVEDEVLRGSGKDIERSWQCGCGHVNGCNLEKCAMCGRTPAESAAISELMAKSADKDDGIPF